MEGKTGFPVAAGLLLHSDKTEKIDKNGLTHTLLLWCGPCWQGKGNGATALRPFPAGSLWVCSVLQLVLAALLPFSTHLYHPLSSNNAARRLCSQYMAAGQLTNHWA